MPQKYLTSKEHRQYIRLDSVFPVEFRLVSINGKGFLSGWLQGFTRNISRGGICLEINNLEPALARFVKNYDTAFELKIELPISNNSIVAVARMSWVQDASSVQNRYFVGLKYGEIDPSDNNKIMRYARFKKLFVPVAMALIFSLSIGSLANSCINMKLVRENKAIVEQFVKVIRESDVAKQEILEVNKKRQELQLKIQALVKRIETVEDEKKLLGEKAALEKEIITKETAVFNKQIGELIAEKKILQGKLDILGLKESAASGELLRLDKEKIALEKANLDKMYHWLVIHQNPRTGLVMSFEGDDGLGNEAFIYDQSLVVQAYLISSDFTRAKKALDFFLKKAKRSNENLFYNAYYTHDGNPAEHSIHSGPNIWLGIAILQYIEKSGDKAYLSLAEEIARAISYLGKEDKDGGIKGGPGIEWYSTEHNLDAYAFFDMLYRITGKQQYLQAKSQVLNWLILHAYDKADVPIRRGKGDSTIATDTYAWSIAAIGPEKLRELGMDPEKILEFAEQNCAVEVDYIRPEGRAVRIKGFDFAPQKHLSRGGVVSSEWTAQMAVSFKIMADYFYAKNLFSKAEKYKAKADEYLSNLGSMIISSPSPSGQGESCLPYATQESVDTGHGWLTPKGRSTGSVAGTAYAFFAYYNYNPLKLKNDR